MEELVNTVNKLQAVFNASGQQFDVDLPQVVVVGTQSSGKSSVLEHLVGKSFLPRGTGIVTRCPLVLQLTRSKDEEYVVFQHDSTKTFTDYSLVCEEIELQTERLAGDDRGICNTPIIIKLYSPNHLDLTLVDLPGLTKVPVGDQPNDIDQQTKDLILEYVKNPKSIMLVVIPANTDMATSESLKISRDVDPEGKRTLAVVTKLDLMDKGTSAVDMLNGNIIPVKLGIIGVVNRSQKDINDGKTIKESLVDEVTFLQKRYGSIASIHGTTYLMKTVQRILINHITTCLPDLKMKVSSLLAKRRDELKLLGKSNLDKPTLMLDFLTKFSRSYCSTIKGDILNIDITELYGGARINNVFQHTFYGAMQSIDALKNLSDHAISRSIENASGASPSLFTPQRAFELLIKRQLKMLRIPCLSCIDLIQEELNKIKLACLKEFGLPNYPKLKHEISTVLSNLIKDRIPPTYDQVNDFLDVQLGYINTAHPDFAPMTILKKNEKTPSSFSFNGLSFDDYNLSNCELMKELLQSYFNIVQKIIQDTVPKIIMHFMVHYIMDCLEPTLVARLYGCEASYLLEESPEIIAERKRLEIGVITLEEANEILNSLSSSHNI